MTTRALFRGIEDGLVPTRRSPAATGEMRRLRPRWRPMRPAAAIIATIAATLAWGAEASHAAIQFPLVPSANGHYLVDSSPAHTPFMLVGDSPWSLGKYVSTAPNPSNPDGESDAAYRLDLEARSGVNAVIVCLVGCIGNDNSPNWNGHTPFTNASDITTWSTPFFDDFKPILDLARARGMLVEINPIWETLWPAYGGTNTLAQWQSFGAFLAQEYAAYPNIAWVLGGDDLSHTAQDDAIAKGIVSVTPGALITGHGHRFNFTSSWFQPLSSYSWLNLNADYGPRQDTLQTEDNYPCPDANPCPGSPYRPALNIYQQAYLADIPNFLVEGWYEGSAGYGSADFIRRQAYWPLLSGATGANYGNDIWSTGTDETKQNPPSQWKTLMPTETGFNELTCINSILGSRAWTTLAPDFNHTYISGSGVGATFGAYDWATDARAADGSLLAVYLPPTGTSSRQVTVAAGALSSTYTAEWVDPTNGQAQAIAGTFSSTSAQSFTSPGQNAGGGSTDNDWVLLAQPTGVGGPSLPFSDNFENCAGNWTPRSGSWSIVTASGSNHSYQGFGTTNSISSAGNTTWTNYTTQATVDVTSSPSIEQVAILARYQDANDYYWFGFYNGNWQIWKVVNGTWTQIGASVPGTLTLNKNYVLTATVNGSNLSFTATDGTSNVSVSGTDSSLSSGAIGTFVGTSTTADFDNVSAGPIPVFNDNFESGLGNWTAHSGTWSQVVDSGSNDRYQGSGVGNTVSSAGSATWTDYEMRAKVKVTATTNIEQVALLARYQDPNDYYWFGFYDGDWQIWKVVAGTWTQLASVPGALTMNSDYFLAAAVKGSVLTLTETDGTQNVTISASDSALTTGSIGLFTGTGTTAEFDDVSVR